MKVILKIVLFLMMASSLKSFAMTGTESHGGDPIRVMFDEARGYAIDRILNAKACSFSVNTPVNIVNWIMQHQKELANDVQNSPHTWTMEKQHTCGLTQLMSMAPISFSFDACRAGVRDINDAIQLIVHESTHHFGIANETFADSVGVAIADIGEDPSCVPVASNDPFDPNSCPGRHLSQNELALMIPMPDAPSIYLGTFKMAMRERVCFEKTNCTYWQDVANPFLNTFTGKPGKFQTLGGVEATMIANVPYIEIRSGDSAEGNFWKAQSSISTVGELKSDEVGQIPLTGKRLLPLKVFPSGLSTSKQNWVYFSSLSGWVTPTCLRQTSSISTTFKDPYNNDLVLQDEIVILSTFMPIN